MDTVKTYTNGLNLCSVTKKSLSLFRLSCCLALSLSLSAHYGTRSLHCLSQITWSMKLEPHTVWSEARLHLSTVRTLCKHIPTIWILQCPQRISQFCSVTKKISLYQLCLIYEVRKYAILKAMQHWCRQLRLASELCVTRIFCSVTKKMSEFCCVTKKITLYQLYPIYEVR